MTKKDKRYWVIGDIHGMYDPLKRIVDKIRFIRVWDDRSESLDLADPVLIFIGDYIDYGPSSKEVIDLLMELKNEFECVFLCGNHEDMLLQFMRHSDLFEHFGNMWFRDAGGQNTVISFMPQPDIYEKLYGRRNDNEGFTRQDFILEQKYLDFFDSLVYSHTETLTADEETIKLAFTHANLLGPQNEDTNVSVEEQLTIKTYEDFHRFRKDKKIWIESTHIWNRDWPTQKFDEYILFHGHTPTPMYAHKYNNLGAFKPESILPYVSFDTDTVEVSKKYDKLHFSKPLSNVISINTDTGAAYGSALTAISFIDHELLYRNKMTVYKALVNRTRLEPEVEVEEFKFSYD
ncbi:MAG: serine/threonine protein phosphatase [bacterium]|nr:serine/threonine protein phosphatase [bacterium]